MATRQDHLELIAEHKKHAQNALRDLTHLRDSYNERIETAKKQLVILTEIEYHLNHTDPFTEPVLKPRQNSL